MDHRVKFLGGCNDAGRKCHSAAGSSGSYATNSRSESGARSCCWRSNGSGGKDGTGNRAKDCCGSASSQDAER